MREEKTNRLVEVGPHPDDEIRPLGYNYSTLTLGDVRAFLAEHGDAPDNTPVMIALPLSFFSDLDDIPADHPKYKAVSECHSVEACGIGFTGLTEHGDFAEWTDKLKLGKDLRALPLNEVLGIDTPEGGSRVARFSVKRN